MRCMISILSLFAMNLKMRISYFMILAEDLSNAYSLFVFSSLGKMNGSEI